MDNPLVQPTVHMNGTNAADLLEGYCVARQAVTAAMQKLAEYASPNGRDYYPLGNFPAAQDQYEAWQESLRKVAKDLEALCDYTSDFVK